LLLCCYAVVRPTTSADPLSCGPDVNLDGVVDVFDLVRVAAKYGMEVPGGLLPWAKEDTNGDGKICIADLVCVSSNYGRGVTATPTATPSTTPTNTPPTPTPTPTGTPSPTPAAVCPPGMPGGLTAALVTRVVDGDTIDVNIAGKTETVRYTGINTPRVEYGKKPIEPFGPEACAVNAGLVGGRVVYLERDIQDRESGVEWEPRLLRYVWVDGEMVNARLVQLGLADASPYWPDVRYRDCFAQLELEAKAAGRGKWGEPWAWYFKCDCSRNRYDCDDFGSREQAQACYEYCLQLAGYDSHMLDKDNDDRACESLPSCAW